MAILLPPLVAAGVIGQQLVAVLLRRPWFLAGAASWLVFGLVTTVGPWLPLDTGTPAEATSLTIAVANVAVHNRWPLQVVADILDQQADVVVVPEATLLVHRGLAEAYDHAVRAEAPYSAAIGIYSDLPLREVPAATAGELEQARVAVVAVAAPAPFTLWGLHLLRPWFTTDFPNQSRPRGQADLLDEVLERANAPGSGPTVLAGDLNLTDRGRGYRRATERHDDALRGAWGRPTSVKRSLRPLLLRIDHVLVPDGWCAAGARQFDLTGSDHRGVAVRIGPCETGDGGPARPRRG